VFWERANLPSGFRSLAPRRGCPGAGRARQERLVGDVRSPWQGGTGPRPRKRDQRPNLYKTSLVVGPPRGGKGVIARILTAVIGHQNVAGSTLNSIGANSDRHS
jgi:hypothetical protein